MKLYMKLYGARRSHARNGTKLPDRTKRHASDLMLILLVRFSLPLPLASRLSLNGLNHRLKIPANESRSFPFSLYLSNNDQRLAAAARQWRHQYASIPSLASFLTFYYIFPVHPAQQRRVHPLLDDVLSLMPLDSILSRDFLDVYKQSSHLSRMTLASLCTCQSQSFPLVFSFSCAFSSSRLVISVPALWTCCLQVPSSPSPSPFSSLSPYFSDDNPISQPLIPLYLLLRLFLFPNQIPTGSPPPPARFLTYSSMTPVSYLTMSQSCRSAALRSLYPSSTRGSYPTSPLSRPCPCPCPPGSSPVSFSTSSSQLWREVLRARKEARARRSVGNEDVLYVMSAILRETFVCMRIG